ncbi:MAG: DNA repair protein RecO [Chitinophagales bacterium]
MHYRVSALVLKSINFKETDQIVTMLSHELGKVRAIARGVKKPRSTLRGLVQPFCHSHFYMIKTGDMFLITQGKIIDFYGGIREDLNKTLQSAYLMELADKSLIDEEPAQSVLDLALSILKYIDEKPLSPLPVRYFETRLLGLLGYEPILKHCSSCGARGGLNHFSSNAGGALCGKCSNIIPAVKVKPSTLAIIHAMQNQTPEFLTNLHPTPEMEKEMERVLEDFLEYYLDKRFNIKSVIRVLKASRLN